MKDLSLSFETVAAMANWRSSARRLVMVPLVFCLCVLSCANVSAQNTVGNTQGGSKWQPVVGTIVEVDGLAWGIQSKGLGPHLVLPIGKVFLRNIDLNQTDLNGRLIRVSGVLRKTRNEKVPKGVQGYSQSIDDFYIEAIEVARIDKVLHPLLPSQHDWIVAGMPIDKATELMRSRRLGEYGLALAASPDGVKAHSYQVGESKVLVFYEKEGRVKSVVKVRVNRASRSGDKWSPVPAYRLPGKLNRP